MIAITSNDEPIEARMRRSYQPCDRRGMVVGLRGVVIVGAVATSAACIEEVYTPLPCTELERRPAIMNSIGDNDVVIRLQCADGVERADSWGLAVPERASDNGGHSSFFRLTVEPIVDGQVTLRGPVRGVLLRDLNAPVDVGIAAFENSQLGTLLTVSWPFATSTP